MGSFIIFLFIIAGTLGVCELGVYLAIVLGNGLQSWYESLFAKLAKTK